VSAPDPQGPAPGPAEEAGGVHRIDHAMAQALAGWVLSQEAEDAVGDVRLGKIREVWAAAWQRAIAWAQRQAAYAQALQHLPATSPAPPAGYAVQPSGALGPASASINPNVPAWWTTGAGGTLQLGGSGTIYSAAATGPAARTLVCPVCGIETPEHWNGFGPNPNVVRLDLPGVPNGPYCGPCYGRFVVAHVPLLEPKGGGA
jgi:hypothetical protein